MKKVTIFLTLLFFISAIWYGPANVHVEAGLSDRLINRIDDFSDTANTARNHMDYLQVMKDELQHLNLQVHSIPDSFDQSGINGIFSVTKLLANVVIDFISFPVVMSIYMVTFIVDAIVIIFKFLDFFTLFT